MNVYMGFITFLGNTYSNAFYVGFTEALQNSRYLFFQNAPS